MLEIIGNIAFVIIIGLLFALLLEYAVLSRDMNLARFVMVGLVALIIGMEIYSKLKEKEKIEQTVNHIKKGNPVVCYENIFSNKGILIKNPKLINDSQVVSKDGKTFPVSSCEIVEEGQ